MSLQLQKSADNSSQSIENTDFTRSRSDSTSNSISREELLKSEFWKKVFHRLPGRKALILQETNQPQWRDYLVDAIIQVELEANANYTISRQRFEHIKSDVLLIIPTESTVEGRENGCDGGLWYTPSNGLIKTRGKLYNKYINERRDLINCGLINVNKNTSVDEQNIDNDGIEKLEFFKHTVEPFDTVLVKWNATYEIRKRVAKNWTIPEKFLNFKALSQPRGYLLLEQDFFLKHPIDNDILYSKWPTISSKIIALSTCRKKEAKVKKFLKENENLLKADCREIAALLLLPILIGPSTAKVKFNGKHWKPKLEDSKDTFLKVVKSEEEVQNFLTEKREFYKQCNSNLGPLAFIVGSLPEISHCYVAVDKTLYHCSTPLNAIDVCFKISAALGCEYPLEGRYPWIFLEKAVYGLSTTVISPNAVTALITDLSSATSEQ
ncbi:uncharacterized protein LOC127286979 [Leptopilina boulardi]|uniref:uncharacterized protein LOC127286979 n=1 Tax=Leptopilina boulardi TaxID=63433 RepID=UPI0021F54C1C|nr:uncharacterized protein LOC127286979 [Leptopilina boulardi]